MPADESESRPPDGSGREPQSRVTTPVPPRILKGADLFLRTALVLGGALLAYFVIHPANRLESPARVLFYYGIPVGFLLVVWSTLRAGAERRAATALLLIAVLAPLYLVEAALPLIEARRGEYGLPSAVADSACPEIWRSRPVCLAAHAAGRDFDTRLPLEVIEDLAERGIEAWPVQGLGNDALRTGPQDATGMDEFLVVEGRRVIPVSPGIGGVTTVFCNETGEWITYEADRFGFRNPAGLQQPGSVDVVLVGDSYAQGYCVSDSASVAGVLRGRIPATVNLGIRGTGPLVHLGAVREYAAPLRPRLVVWMFYGGNDLGDLARELDFPVLRGYLEPGFDQGLRESQDALNDAIRSWLVELRSLEADAREGDDQEPRSLRRHPLVRWIRLAELRSRIRRALGPDPPDSYSYDPGVLSRIARGMKSDVEAVGGRLLFFYVPDYERFADRGLENPHRERILDDIAALGIPTLDPTPRIAEHPDPLSLFRFRVPAHYTEEGYAILADAILEWIEQNAPEAGGSVESAPGTDP